MKVGRHWWLNRVELPPFGYSVVQGDQLIPLESGTLDIFQRQLIEASQAYLQSAVVENDYHRLTFDRSVGGVISWFDKRLNREIIDATVDWRFGGVVYERLADLQHPSPRRLLYDPVSTVRDMRGWRTD